MQALAFVMAIMGCGESDAACREVRVDQTAYRTEASCRAATATALARHTDLEFPTVVARCRPANAQAQLLRGSDVLLPGPGRLPAGQTRRLAARVSATRWLDRPADRQREDRAVEAVPRFREQDRARPDAVEEGAA